MRRLPVAALQRRLHALERRPRTSGSSGGTSSSDADTLQGHPAADFALAGHTHAIVVVTTLLRPAAAAGLAGTWIRVKDAGEPTQVQVCCQSSSGGYEWVTVAQSS